MASAEEKLKAYVDAIEKDLETQIQGALNGMPLMDRRVLAIRGYLRFPSMGRGSIGANWAWSNQDMEEFKKTAEFTKMKEAVADVKSTFAGENPGFTLGVDPDKVRSLETQVELWNQNPTVQRLGLELKTKLLKTLESLPDIPDETSLQAFKKVLVEASLSNTPSNATPGLSQHGQAKAFDFVVFKGRDVVAGTVTATLKEKWDDAGWTAKLKSAVQAAGGKFVGPLPAPYEPWHYIYKAAAATAEARTGTGSTFSSDMCGTSLRRH
ncbi:hypothetical protein SAMN05444166_4889 [Singulisphaera sp. GP187]|uniref:hypothetical protein n=1 Tax=Singulisphaera sp. GP187 TaxID=1882752 RepID=UPI000927AEF5|nr:hypothetical protein [Singulisphaera sp. GP187]SIO45716.1 hypothetical protein SAMN05444166_4889 [Singulisphaera sp. GP187]